MQPEQAQQEQTQEQKFGQRLIMMDGMTIENASCGYAEGNLWCWLPGYTMQAAAAIFFDPSKTGKITFEYGEMTDVYEGFTNCASLLSSPDQISVCMKKG